MSSCLDLHRFKLLILLALANLSLLLHLWVGEPLAMALWNWMDILGEGGAALLSLAWIWLLLKSRPEGVVTRYLFVGLACLFLALWTDCLDELVQLPIGVRWDTWLESGSMLAGFISLTLGIYHWHCEQLALNVQMEKRERLFREHRLFDSLTPLCRAGYLRLQLQQALVEAGQRHQPLSLAILDLRGFSHLNRDYGAAEGDRILQTLSQLLLLNLRRQDLLCRLAGDRFVVLLPNTCEPQACQVAEELQQAVAHLAYRTERQGARLQLQVHVAVVMALRDDSKSLLHRLNLALARAKQPLHVRRA